MSTPAGPVRQLSVAEIQAALRDLLVRPPGTVAPGVACGEDAVQLPGGGVGRSSAPLSVPVEASGDGAWVAVVGAHAGAGASTVALALADVLAERGRERCHLVETAPMPLSGLIAAARTELGMDDSGHWRRGTRGPVTLDRRADDGPVAPWPSALPEPARVHVLDLGVPAGRPDEAELLARAGATVLVCRATVPGVRAAAAEVLRWAAPPTVLVSVGARGWPGPVRAVAGPVLSLLRRTDRVVDVPLARRLTVVGPTGDPLPHPVLKAAQRASALLIAAGLEGGAS